MKKILLTTSALAGASLVAAPAMADAPVMTFSGALAYEMVLFDGDQADAGTGFNVTANEQQSELAWDARGSADNGLNYRANIQWRWANGGAGGNAGTFDEAWLDFTGGFGRLYIGGEDGVSDLVAGTSGHSVQVGTWGTDGNNALRHVNFLGVGTQLGYYASHAGMTGDANKIGYITPNFGGFTAGVSYSPNSTFLQAQGTNDDANANAWELAAGWAGAFGDVTLGIDGSYGYAEDQSGGTVAGFTQNAVTGAITAGGGITTDQEEVSAYMVGGTVGFAGFQIAGAFLDNGESNCTKTVNNCDAGDGWNVGASYNFGPGAVSVMWQTSESDVDGDNLDQSVDILHAGVNYNIAEGLSAHLNGYWFDIENEAGSGLATATNDASVIILGTRITF